MLNKNPLLLKDENPLLLKDENSLLLKDEKQLVYIGWSSEIINKSNPDTFKLSVESFLSKLFPLEREIIRKQLYYWEIDEKDMVIINKSNHDINWFLSSCKNLTELEKVLVEKAIWDIVSETKDMVMNIINKL